MPKTITEPGIYPDFPEADYYSDPCPEPSLSRSVAKALVDRTPRHAWTMHPRLNPNYEEGGSEAFDIGKAFHTFMLSRGARVLEVEADDWRTNDAKAARAYARAKGLTPLLTPQLRRVEAMAEATLKQLPGFGLGDLFKPDSGKAEVMLTWLDPVAGWCRILIDWLDDFLVVTDLKSTGIPLSEESLGRHCASMGYEFQQAFYESGLVSVFPQLAGRVRFQFLFVETSEPFAVLPVLLPPDAMAKGAAQVADAKAKWAACRQANIWPLYSGAARTLEYPPWSTAEYSAYTGGENG